MAAFLRYDPSGLTIYYDGEEEKTAGYRNGSRWKVWRANAEGGRSFWLVLIVGPDVTAQDVLAMAAELESQCALVPGF